MTTFLIGLSWLLVVLYAFIAYANWQTDKQWLSVAYIVIGAIWVGVAILQHKIRAIDRRIKATWAPR